MDPPPLHPDYLIFGLFPGAVEIQRCANLRHTEKRHKKRAGALSSGFLFEVKIVSIFDYRDYFGKVSANGGTAVIDSLRYGDIRVVHVIHQPQTRHFALCWGNAGSAANQVNDLVAVQFTPHPDREGNNVPFAAGLIWPPS